MMDHDQKRVEDLRYAFETLENTAEWLKHAEATLQKRMAVERDLMGDEAEEIRIDLDQAENLATALKTAASNIVGAHQTILGRR